MTADISGTAGNEDWDFAHAPALAKPDAKFQPSKRRRNERTPQRILSADQAKDFK
jgi:hypothetical protein